MDSPGQWLAAQLREEQQALDVRYRRLDELRAEAAAELARLRRSGTAGTPAARVEREALLRQGQANENRLQSVEERLCIGRLDMLDGSRRYIGRIGLTDASGGRILLDWRAPAATAFYRATRAEPEGALSRRHLRTHARTVTGISDEVLDLAAFTAAGGHTEALSSDDTLMLALDAHRTGRLGDIVATIQAEQDRIIRAPAGGVLVVQGGPGTGKTVVALHRAAYLLYAQRDRLARTGVLVVGPNARFLDYISQVLPSLGESGVVLATAGQLFPGVDASALESAEVERLKGDERMVAVLRAAVRARQRVPRRPVQLRVEGSVIQLMPAEVAAARHRAQLARKPHNVARSRFVGELLPKLAARLARAQRTELDEDNRAELLNALRASPDVRREVNLCWMPLTPQRLLRDLYAQPAELVRAAGRLSPAERAALRRDRAAPWTPADVALLDEAAELLGEEPDARDLAEEAELAAEREYAGQVLDRLADATPEAAQVTTAAALAERYLPAAERRGMLSEAATDRNWAFGHVVVDEAQELSAMQWRMLLRRCPSRSMTVVGDIAQTGSAAGAGSWQQALQPHLAERWRLVELSVNYRTPAEIMQAAQAMLAAAGVATTGMRSARSVEGSLRLQPVADLARALPAAVAEELAEGGQLAVISTEPERWSLPPRPDLSVLTPTAAKGLEFDTVILLEPAAVLRGSPRGASDLYVAMTRATRRLRILHSQPLPAGLGSDGAGVPSQPASSQPA